MRLHFATIPLHASASAEAELNRFSASRRVLSIELHLVQDAGSSVWAVCVSYVAHDSGPTLPKSAAPPAKSRRERVDYKEVLEPKQFEVFAQLRKLRKEIAEREAVPTYSVFNNEPACEEGPLHGDAVWCADHSRVRETRDAVIDWVSLSIKTPVRIGRSARGLGFLGFRVLPERLRLSRRRRKRYAAARARWEAAYTGGSSTHGGRRRASMWRS